MATVATISIKLDAQTAALKKGFQDSAQATKNLGTQLRQSLGSGIVKINAALSTLRMALGAVSSAFSALRQSVGELAAIGDFADRIEISTEALQGLQMTAERFGGRAEVVNTALQRMQRRIADAARSGGPLADRLAEVGLSVSDLVKMKPDQQFYDVADAIKDMGTAGEQTSFIMALMDTEGVELRNTLAQGGDALRAMTEQFVANGSASEDVIRKAQEMDATFKDLDDRWKAAKSTIMESLLPALKELITWMEAAAETYRKYQDFWNKVWGVGQGGEMQVDPGFDERNEENKRKREEQLEFLNKLMRAMGIHRLELTRVAEARRAAFGPMTVPSIGAVTSASTAGFSALHDARRRAQQREAFERDAIGLLTDIRDIARVRPEPVPVTIL